MYAIGANPTAARLAGIRTNRAIFIGFMLSAIFAGLAGFILLSQVGAAAATAGEGLELAVVTAVVLGGTSLAGGRGSITGTILAVLIVGVLRNGLVQLRRPVVLDRGRERRPAAGRGGLRSTAHPADPLGSLTTGWHRVV